MSYDTAGVGCWGACNKSELVWFVGHLDVLPHRIAETATDLDYERIEGVIGHEYFHNWTGNRVTCK